MTIFTSERFILSKMLFFKYIPLTGLFLLAISLICCKTLHPLFLVCPTYIHSLLLHVSQRFGRSCCHKIQNGLIFSSITTILNFNIYVMFATFFCGNLWIHELLQIIAFCVLLLFFSLHNVPTCSELGL